MSWIATAIVASSVIGGAMSSNAAESAASTQANAADQASANSLSEFNTINNQQQPWIQQGTTAINQLGTMTAPGGSMVGTFNNSDLNANLAPNYQFSLNQGLGTASNEENSSGGLIGGNAMQGLNSYAQNYAQNAYQQAYNNYQTSNTNIFNRLSDIAQIGQTSSGVDANAGIASTNAANGYATSAAAAQAAGTVGSANAISNGLSSAGISLASLLGSGGSSSASSSNGIGLPGAYTSSDGSVYNNPSAYSDS